MNERKAALQKQLSSLFPSFLMVLLLKHHVLLCGTCGSIQASSAKERAKCLSCGHSWVLCQKGLTIGVLGSYWRPADAGAHVRKAKEARAAALPDGRAAAQMEAGVLCGSGG